MNNNLKFAAEHNEIQFPGSFPVGTFIGISLLVSKIKIGKIH